ncbi:MFS transporter [Nitrospirillum amazonense]|uniref:MFS transporter n=1 Tax=Nitrospirillum amazonense TaxID=28077 RepID=UPI001FEC48A5|nr:MFS transporter [Nitrospirillum amazonense]
MSVAVTDAAAAPGVIPAVVPRPRGRYRWLVCFLLFSAVALSYVDRQVLGVLKPLLQDRYGWTEVGYGTIVFWFQAAYASGYLVFGRLVDRIGARAGYALAVGIWTIAHMAHAAAGSVASFAIVRIPLALGESGAFPASLAAVAEWFPQRERALAIGLTNAGANVGAVLTPLIVPAVTLAWGWRAAFLVTGLFTVVWLAAWLALYRRPREVARLSPGELAYIEADPVPPPVRLSWRRVLGARETWAYILGRFVIDPIWWTFLFWLPDFFAKRYGLDLKGFGPPLVLVYILADMGSVLGGWGSSRLLARGVGLNRARKTAFLVCALVVAPVALAMDTGSLWGAALLIGLACAGHQGFSVNLYALPSDLFPRWAAGSVIGLGGAAGGIGSMAMAQAAGWILQTTGSYRPIFLAAASAYFVALALIHWMTPGYAPARLTR